MKVESLYIFPIKGLRGIRVQSARVTDRGLEFDRRFMLTTPNGRFISQRSHPALTHLEVQMGQDKRESEQTFVTITNPEGRQLEVGLQPDQGDSVVVDIWGDRVVAWTGFEEADRFFSAFLGEDVRFVWMPPQADRPADREFASPNDQVSFADGYPILVLGTASVEELNQRLAEPVPINRFRANILVSGSQPWQEDEWVSMELPSAKLRTVKKCARCVVITIDQETGQSGREPTATLATYRREGNKVFVGMNAIPDGEGGVISVGDEIIPTLR